MTDSQAKKQAYRLVSEAMAAWRLTTAVPKEVVAEFWKIHNVMQATSEVPDIDGGA